MRRDTRAVAVDSVRCGVAGVALLLATTTVVGAQPAKEAPTGWAFRKPITLPALARPGLVELRLDADVLRDASPTLADLRVRDAQDADVPHAIRRRDGAGESAREAAMLHPVATPDGGVRVVLDAGAGRIAHDRVRLTIRRQARNFRVPVRVETAEDGQVWHPVREAGFIYRVEGETRAADTTVSYPRSTAGWLRVSVGGEKGRALPLAGAAVFLTAARERDEERVPAVLIERDQESMRRTTRLVLDLRARRPADRVELDVAERRFQRVVLIEAGDDRKTWRWVGSYGLSAVDLGAVRERTTGSRFPATTARYLRLTIQNLDDTPLTVTGARVFAARRSLVFEATPGRRYVLDYGNPAAGPPNAGLAGTVAHAAGGRLPEVRLGSIQGVQVPPPTAWVASRPLVVSASMAMALLALGSLLWRLARGVRAG